MIRYYKENTGDYLAVDFSSPIPGSPEQFEARATAIQNNRLSVCTTGVARAFLREQCKRVPKGAVPAEWLQLF